MRLLRLIVTILVLLLLALFAGSNRAPVTLRLWPTDYAATLPLSLAILGAALLAFLAGGMFVWIGTFARRRQLRRLEDTVRLLEDRLNAMKAQQAEVPALSPPAA
jgi:uncharacterized integral membrane protein